VDDDFARYLDRRKENFKKETGIELTYPQVTKLELLREHPNVSPKLAIQFLNLNNGHKVKKFG